MLLPACYRILHSNNKEVKKNFCKNKMTWLKSVQLFGRQKYTIILPTQHFSHFPNQYLHQKWNCYCWKWEPRLRMPCLLNLSKKGTHQWLRKHLALIGTLYRNKKHRTGYLNEPRILRILTKKNERTTESLILDTVQRDLGYIQPCLVLYQCYWLDNPEYKIRASSTVVSNFIAFTDKQFIQLAQLHLLGMAAVNFIAHQLDEK